MFGTAGRIVRFWRVVQVLQVTGGMDSAARIAYLQEKSWKVGYPREFERV